MTIELKLPPELELRAKECADADFEGDLQEMLRAALQAYLLSQPYDDAMDQMLLEAELSPTVPLPTDLTVLIDRYKTNAK